MSNEEVSSKKSAKNVFIRHEELEKANHYNDLEREAVKQKVISDGCLIEPLVLWSSKKVLVSGYEEFAIAQELNLPYEVKEIEFESVSDCLSWIGEKKLAVPSLNSFQKAEIGLTFWEYWKDKDEAKYGAKSPLKKAAMDRYGRADKSAIVGIKSGLSHNSVFKVSCILDSKNKKLIEECRKGEISIHAAHELINPKDDEGGSSDEKKAQLKTKQKQNEIDSLAKYCSVGFSSTKEKLDEHGLKFFILRWNEEHSENQIDSKEVQQAVKTIKNKGA